MMILSLCISTRRLRGHVNHARLVNQPIGDNMHHDDDTPKKPAGISRNLEALSVADMQDYIAELKLEIFRTEAEIAKRSDVKNAAETFFRRAD